MRLERREEKARRNSRTTGQREEAAQPRKKTHSHVMGVYFVQVLPRASIVVYPENSDGATAMLTRGSRGENESWARATGVSWLYQIF